MVFAFCPRTERPTIFFRRHNKKGKGDQEYTRLQLSLKDGETLMAEFARLLKEMEETPDGTTIPTLANKKLPTTDHKSNEFWDPSVTWTSESGKIRCRPVENGEHEFSIVINQPRTEDQPCYDNYLGPTLYFPRGGARAIMTKINTNLKRYANNVD